MKTKLFSFYFLFLVAVSYAQFNVTENFDSSSVFPSNWTIQNFGLNTASNGCSGSNSAVATIYSNSPATTLTTPSYTSDGNHIKVEIKYRAYNIFNLFAQVMILYEVDNSEDWIPLQTTSQIDGTCRVLKDYILPNVVPAGSTIRFKFYAYATGGQANIVLDDFSAIQATPELLFKYTFDNVRHNTNGDYPFADAGTSFATDRFSNSNSSLLINATSVGVSASIPQNLLPTGNDTRTISLWYKVNGSLPNFTGIFAYGISAANRVFGAYLGYTGNPYFQCFANDTDFGGNYPSNTWWHLVVSYDKTNINMYINGALIGTQPYNAFDGNNLDTGFSNFTLAQSSSSNNTQIDDLMLFDGPLTSEQVLNLYNNNTLSSSNFSQNSLEIKLHPNPVRDILNIEIENDIQLIEIYNIQGQKVLSSNQKQINVSDLATGMYMVRIQDTENNIATKKVVIK